MILQKKTWLPYLSCDLCQGNNFSFFLCLKVACDFTGISPVVSEKKFFNNVDRRRMSDLWPKHDLDL